MKIMHLPVASNPPPSSSANQAMQWILAHIIGVVNGSMVVYISTRDEGKRIE